MGETAVHAFGTKIKRKSGNNSFVEIARLADISGPSMEKDEIETTTHDSESGYREFIGGLKDAGEVEAEAFFLKANKTHQDEIKAFDQRGNTTYRLVFPDEKGNEGAYFEFDAFVTGMEFSAELEDAIKIAFTWKVSGKPEFNFTGNGDNEEESGGES